MKTVNYIFIIIIIINYNYVSEGIINTKKI